MIRWIQFSTFFRDIDNFSCDHVLSKWLYIVIRWSTIMMTYFKCDFLQTVYKISFGQIYLSKPMMTESDGETASLFPKAARLRNLTYSAPLYVDVSKRVIKKGHDGEEVTETQDFTKVFIGKVSLDLDNFNFGIHWLSTMTD